MTSLKQVFMALSIGLLLTACGAATSGTPGISSTKDFDIMDIHPTQLQLSAAAGDLRAVNHLLNSGADPNEMDWGGRTPLVYAVAGEDVAFRFDPFTLGSQVTFRHSKKSADSADDERRYQIVKLLLLRGAAPTSSARTYDSNALAELFFTGQQLYATRAGYLKVADLLLEKGVTIDKSDGFQRWALPPLRSAAVRGHVDDVKYLISRGAKAFFAIDNGQFAPSSKEVVRIRKMRGWDLQEPNFVAAVALLQAREAVERSR